jgi:hypothetical protein
MKRTFGLKTVHVACALELMSRSLKIRLFILRGSSQVGANRLWQTTTLLVAGLVSQYQTQSSILKLLFIIRRNKLDAFDVAAA